MQFIQPFRSFDPINGELHKKTPLIIRHYLKISRKILVNRNYEEIEFAISTINYLLDGGRELLIDSNLIEGQENSDKEIKTFLIEEFLDELATENEHFTPSSLIYNIYVNFNIEIDNQDDFPNAKWAEYFAVLALVEIGEMQESDILSMHPDELSSRSAEIAESIAYAKTFLELEKSEGKVSRTVLSLNARKGGIKSNKIYNDIKSDFIKWFDSEYCLGKDDSEIIFAQAARQFYGRTIRPIIDNDDTHPIAAQKMENTFRMLKSALREHRRLRSNP